MVTRRTVTKTVDGGASFSLDLAKILSAGASLGTSYSYVLSYLAARDTTNAAQQLVDLRF